MNWLQTLVMLNVKSGYFQMIQFQLISKWILCFLFHLPWWTLFYIACFQSQEQKTLLFWLKWYKKPTAKGRLASNETESCINNVTRGLVHSPCSLLLFRGHFIPVPAPPHDLMVAARAPHWHDTPVPCSRRMQSHLSLGLPKEVLRFTVMGIFHAHIHLHQLFCSTGH